MSSDLTNKIARPIIKDVKPRQIIDFYGGGDLKKTAIAIGVSRQTLYNWLKAGKVPQLWQAWIERHSKKKLKADN